MLATNADSGQGPATLLADPPDFFDLAPSSLWLEDYSGLRKLFDIWRAEGVTDLRRYLVEDPSRIAACSASIKILRVNRYTLSLYAAASLTELTNRLDEVFRDDMFAAHLDELEQLWNGQCSFQSQTVNYTLDGRRIDIVLKGVVLQNKESDWDRVLVSVENITELEEARRRQNASEQYARGIFDQSPVSLWVENFRAIKSLLDDLRAQGITDFRTFIDVHPEFISRCLDELQVLDVNAYTLGMFKAQNKSELLKRLPEVFRDEMRIGFREELLDLWEGRLFIQREVVNYALDGSTINIHLQLSVFPGHEQNWDLVLLALTDITARKKAEAYLEYLGTHDVLTTLKNRSFYVDELKRLERKAHLPITAIVVDLNNLKTTNDSHGHSAGDALLRRAGEVLSKAIEKPSQAARIGGDEFVILLPGTDAHAGKIMLENIHQLVELNNQFYTGPKLSLSIGMATCHNISELTETLRIADLAMYKDKREYHLRKGEDRRQLPM